MFKRLWIVYTSFELCIPENLLNNYNLSTVKPLQQTYVHFWNLKGPGPPDDSTTQHVVTNTNVTHHLDLTDKTSSLSNSHDTTTTTCSACPSGSCLNFSSTEESERDYELSSVSSPLCNCGCDCTSANIGNTSATSPTAAENVNSSVTNESLSLSSFASVANLKTNYSAFMSGSRQHHHHQHYVSSPSATSTCNISSAISSVNACATGPATTNSSYLCSTSAPTGASLATRSLARKLVTSTHNNNTCSINNNSTSTTTTTLCSLANKSPPPHTNSSSSRGFVGFFCSNNSRSTSKTDINDAHHHQQQQQQHHGRLQQQRQHHPHSHHHEHSDSLHQKQLRDSDSLSDVSDTFEWWFQKHKRNSIKKHRYIKQHQAHHC